MARLSNDELQRIMKEAGVSRIWSWSKWNRFNTSPYEYYLRDICNIPEDRTDCIYTTTGGLAHNILEQYYLGKIPYEKMAKEFEDGWTTSFVVADMKFDRNSEENNSKISEKYYENLKHFFLNHVPLKYKPQIEQFVKAKIGDSLFQGYIDVCFKDKDGCYNILDWKTSTIYKGKKAENECGQLVVYAIGLNQMGIPFDKIRIGWNFLKYVSIQYEQANGAVKTREVERCKIGESLQSNAKTWLKRFGYEKEMDNYLKALIDTNNIQCLPEEVQQKYVVNDCYIFVPLTQELIDGWTDKIITVIKDIELREKDYEETKNDKVFWDTDEMVEAQSYYFSTLCGYSPNLHLPYKAYLERLEAAENDVFNGVGNSESRDVEIETSTNKVIPNKSGDDSIDLSWLDSI